MRQLIASEIDGIWGPSGRRTSTAGRFTHNEESNVCLYDASLVASMEETFLADLKECKRIDWETWQRRGVMMRSQELVATLLQEQA